MWPLAIIGGGLLFWLWWTRRLSSAAMLPLVLALLGITFLLRGQMLPGGGSLLLAGFTWLARRTRKVGARTRDPIGPTDKDVLKAEKLLGLKPGYDRDTVELAYRQKAMTTHPDHGGSEEAMQQLSAARALLALRLTRLQSEQD